MGYVRKRKTYRLVFADPEFEGLEVVTRAANFGSYQRIADLANREFSTPPSTDDLAEIDELLRCFASVLVSWNLEEEDGTAVPATLAGLQSQDLPFVMTLILAWMEAVSSAVVSEIVPGDLSALEGELPMEALAP